MPGMHIIFYTRISQFRYLSICVEKAVTPLTKTTRTHTGLRGLLYTCIRLQLPVTRMQTHLFQDQDSKVLMPGAHTLQGRNGSENATYIIKYK